MAASEVLPDTEARVKELRPYLSWRHPPVVNAYLPTIRNHILEYQTALHQIRVLRFALRESESISSLVSCANCAMNPPQKSTITLRGMPRSCFESGRASFFRSQPNLHIPFMSLSLAKAQPCACLPPAHFPPFSIRLPLASSSGLASLLSGS
jgi:hypothetical protein